MAATDEKFDALIEAITSGALATAPIIKGDGFEDEEEHEQEDLEEGTYYTVRIPYSKKRTPWHPERPGQALTRGSFKSRKQAEAWAEKEIPGYEYQVAKITY